MQVCKNTPKSLNILIRLIKLIKIIFDLHPIDFVKKIILRGIFEV